MDRQALEELMSALTSAKPTFGARGRSRAGGAFARRRSEVPGSQDAHGSPVIRLFHATCDQLERLTSSVARRQRRRDSGRTELALACDLIARRKMPNWRSSRQHRHHPGGGSTQRLPVALASRKDLIHRQAFDRRRGGSDRPDRVAPVGKLDQAVTDLAEFWRPPWCSAPRST